MEQGEYTDRLDKRTKPILRWAGSKRKQIPQLRQFFPHDFKRYIEPFAGSAALCFELNPKSAVLGDKNPNLINTYRQLRKKPKILYEALTSISRTKTAYDRFRRLDPQQLDAFERAVWFIFLNRNCFNEIYRTNRQGFFNVPFSKSRVGCYPDYSVFSKVAVQLRRFSLVCGDFESVVLQNAGRGDLVYLDPPFAVSNKRIFREYEFHSFGVNDISRLRRLLQLIDSRGANFILSYSNNEIIHPLAKEWKHREITVTRHIAGFAENRRKDSEVIITNY